MGNTKRRKKTPTGIYIFFLIGFVLFLIGVGIMIKRYTPTKEHMSLEEYYALTEEKEAAVIINGKYYEVTNEEKAIHAIHTDDGEYLEISFLKKKLDDGYVYDKNEGVLRYVTDKAVVSVNVNEKTYTVGKEKESLKKPIVIAQDGSYFVSLDFVEQFTDITWNSYENPNRIVIETVGYAREMAVLKKDVPLRRFGGVKSKILKDAKKGDQVGIIENYGKWSYVVTEDGVLACVQNRKMEVVTKKVTEARLEPREYEHNLLDGDIILGWHQVTSASANSTVEDVVPGTKMNVISPTWFYLNDNDGNIANLASREYVSYCHDRNIQVWGLVSNLENDEVDSTVVLNSTSARDNLVNQLIAAAITNDLDGINIDMEALSGKAKDGYIEFIKELSIKCKKNDLILSVDNYVPSESTEFYNRSVQADYADYIIIMAYDEHYSGSTEAGSVASIGFVEKGVKDTLEEVPAEQIILGMPFYARVWAVTDNGITSSAYGMDDMKAFLERNDVTTAWSEVDGQNYGEFIEDNTTYKVWVEDAASLGKKLEVMEENKLAGAAFWKLGFETDSIWKTIAQYLKK